MNTTAHMEQREAELQSMVRRIVERFHPRRVVLFGSHARGQAGPDSDVDLLVIVDVQGSVRKLANEIDMALADRKLPLDLVVMTPEQYARRKDIEGTVAHEAAVAGRVMHGRAA